MSLQYQIKEIPNASIYIWKIEEKESFFVENMPWNEKQLLWLDSIHPLKKIEYLASRYLIYFITGKLDSHLYKDEAGKLHLANSNQNLSISHSDEWVGLALSQTNIGFDLQKKSDSIKRISKRFLSQMEYDVISKDQNDELLIVSWCIKEAVYKAHGKKGILFSEQIHLDLSDFKTNKLISRSELKLTDNAIKYEIKHGWKEDFGWALALEI